MKNLFKKLKKLKLRSDLIVVLVGIVLVVLVINIIFFINRSQKETQDPTEIDQIKNLNQNEENATVTINDYPDSKELLDNLPHSEKSFDASYLPLEKNIPPKILIELYNTSGRGDFQKWVVQYSYATDIEFIYLEQQQLEGPINQSEPVQNENIDE